MFNFIFVITFIVTLLVSGASAGPYIAKDSFAQPAQYPSSSFPSPSTSSSTNASLIQITAGKIQDISFTINNNNAPLARTLLSVFPRSLSQLQVSIASQSTAVTILGPATWNLRTIPSESGLKFTTQVFASASAIGTPVFFTVTIQYIQNGYQVRSATFNLGATVVGLIQLGVNNLNVRYAGNTATLSGNILNQGNTPALFSTIKMLNQPQGRSTSNKNPQVILVPTASQYLGTIAANLPLPFNIPLQAVRGGANNNNNNITSLAAYPVSFQITYTDTLKIIHNLIINNTVNLLGVEPLIQKTIVASNALQGNNAISISDPDPALQQQPLPQLPFGNGFVDSYWAQNVAQSTVTSGGISTNGTALTNMLPVPVQIQTGPDYGEAILAVELTNTAFYSIGGITGYLTLPAGFTAATGGSSSTNLYQGTGNINVNQVSASTQTYREPQTAIAAYPSTVSIGQTYTLYFKVDIGNAAVGSYLASLKLYYYQLPLITPGEYRVQTISVPFNLKGTVVLDSVPKTTSLNPGEANPAVIQIVNRGTAPARNVIAAIQPAVRNVVYPPAPVTLNTNASTGGQIITQNPPSLVPVVNVGGNTFHVGTIPPNGTAVINPIFYPSYSAGGTLQTFNMTLTYVDTGGNTQSTTNSFGFSVSPEPPQAGVNVGPTGGLGISPGGLGISPGGLGISPGGLGISPGGLGISPGVSPSNNTGPSIVIPHSHSHSHSHIHSHSANNAKIGNSTSGIAVSTSYTTTDASPKTINNNTTNNAVHILPAVYKVTPANQNNNTASKALSNLAAVTNSSGNNNNVMKNNNLQQNTTPLNTVTFSSYQNDTSLHILPAAYKVTPANQNNNTASKALSNLAAVTNGSGNNNNVMKSNSLRQNTTSPNSIKASSGHQNNTSLILTALTVEDMKFHLTNFNDTPITDAIISISSQSGDVKIVGDDVWTVPVIPPHTTREFSTKVYASTSLIASPVSFNVLLQYVSKGQSVAGSFILSGTVIGSIVPTISGGLSISYIAGVPNLVGNLLNEGTTTGLFTTVQMINEPFRPVNSSTAAPGAASGGNRPVSFYQQSSNDSYSGSLVPLPAPQYLGDLQSDSPLPFSIPLTVDINNTAPGTYPVIFKISYSDDLHRPHVSYLHDSVVVAPHPPPPVNNGGPLAFLGLGGGNGGTPHFHGRHGGVGVGIHHPFGIPLLIWIIIIAAIIIAVILIRRRRKAKQKLLLSESAKEALEDEGGDEDIESLIDSGNKQTGGDSQV
jgi:hypothetical protein